MDKGDWALFTERDKNRKFQAYISKLQQILTASLERMTISLPLGWKSYETIPSTDQTCYIPTIDCLMSVDLPDLIIQQDLFQVGRSSLTTVSNKKLRSMIERLSVSSDSCSIRTRHRNDLLASLTALKGYDEYSTPQKLPCSIEEVFSHYLLCEQRVLRLLELVSEIFEPDTPSLRLLRYGGLWPHSTCRGLLGLLSASSKTIVSPPWKDFLGEVGEALSMFQRARRLSLAAERQDVSAFFEEAENSGRSGWKAIRRPDWLLMEIDNDFLIRPNQVKVAEEMIRPSSSSNSLIQLNMGEGKSSVIVPLIAAAIADGTRLCRVIVLKALSGQMLDILSQRLGSMIGRRIYYMPFSRKTEIDESVVSQIMALQKECLTNCEILLAQPEHILSFKLIGLERLSSCEYLVGSRLMKAQRWLEQNARDILDESDEILDVKFQFIYTMGSQRLMDGQPDRWVLTQAMFGLIERHASALELTYREQIELEWRSAGNFPTIRLLSREIGNVLISRIVHDVGDDHLSSISFEQCPENVKDAALRFIQDPNVDDRYSRVVKEFYKSDLLTWQKLLIVCGLVAYGILLFALGSKRWLVNYGLHPNRCLSAVPYLAKGIPSQSAEFGHPDAAVALTCLSYYYTGLSDSQLRQSFELLHKCDDPTMEYGNWIRNSSLTGPLRSWNGVNLEDEVSLNSLFAALKYNKNVADFFMNHVVFPQEGKEFDEKLSTSGWDIPSQKHHLTTGFSGTNDNRFLLPLSISQQDLRALKHTSGKVLTTVLREESQAYLFAADEVGRQLPASDLIRLIKQHDSNVRVLIDVGTQVLNVPNEEMARCWLQLEPTVDAGIFFDENDNMMVLTRDEKRENLKSSSFQSRLDRCVVYLDEVHTRGTDLKLPINARAAVTLGPRLTKDRLVQGASAKNLDYQGIPYPSCFPQCPSQVQSREEHTMVA